ncbi:phospholipid carrier-dependent glycosyltransferase, partial [archaeon]
MSTSRAHWATASNGLRHVTAPSGSSWSWEEAEEGGVEQGDSRMPSAAWNTPTPPAAMPVSPSARWQPRTPVATVSRANAAPSFSSADAPAIARTASGALLPRAASGGGAPSAGPAAHVWSGSAVAVHGTLSSAALPAARSFASGVPIAGVPIAGDAAASVSMAYQGGGLGLDPATPAGKIAGALQYATAAVNKVARNTFGMDPSAAASSHVQEKYVDSRRAMTRAGGAAATASAAADWLDQLDHVMPFVMFIFAAFVRFYRMDVPAAVVFDETHFGRFTGQYHAGTYLFDIHPPLGKLVFWAVSRMGGYDATQCTFKDIGNEYAPACLFMILRTTATLFACATVSIMYRIARNWGVSVRGAIIAATLLNLDGLNVGESRLILMDSQLIFWCVNRPCAASVRQVGGTGCARARV